MTGFVGGRFGKAVDKKKKSQPDVISVLALF
jgi:hypothetical protein